MGLYVPPRKFQLKKSCALTVLALWSLYSSSSFAASFVIDKDNPWEGGNNAYMIKSENDVLSGNSLTLDGNGYDWTNNPIKFIRLISINKSTDRELVEAGEISHNIVNISNTSSRKDPLGGIQGIYVTPLKDTQVIGNKITLSNVKSNSVKGIQLYYINQTTHATLGPLPGIGSENISVCGNQITFEDVNTTDASGTTGLSISYGSGDVYSNEIKVTGGVHSGGIIGISAQNLYQQSQGVVHQEGSLNVHDNNVDVQNAEFRKLAAVSISNPPYEEAKNNVLTLSGKNIFNPIISSDNSYIFGVYASTSYTDRESPYANISSSIVNISGTLVINKTTTGWSKASIGAARSFTGRVSDNELTFNHLDLDIADGMTVSVYGGYSSLQSGYGMQGAAGEAANNSVKMIGVNEDWSNGVKVTFFGGYSELSNSIGNSVTLSESNIRQQGTPGSAPMLIGGYSLTNSESNSVSLQENSHISGNIVGSISQKGGQLSSTVTISDSSVEGDISLFETGTWNDRGYTTNVPSNETFGQDSTLGITGANSVLSKANLFVTKTAGIKTSNNLLKIDGWQGEVGSLGTVMDDGTAVGFDRLAISGVAWKDGAVLIKSLADPSQGQYTVFSKGAIDDTSLVFTSAPTLEENEQVTILQADNGITYMDSASTVKQKNVKASAGTATEFDGTVNFEDNQITYSVEKVERAQQTTVLGDSRIAAAAFVNQSNDLLAHVFSTFMHDQKYGLATFASAEGNRSQYDLDSSLKINGWNFMAGLRYKDRLSVGDWTSAIFFENGEGNYRTWNEHLGYRFKTNGELTYNGAGIASRLMSDSGLYAEGSLHLGQLKIDMNNALLDTAGNNWDFDSRSMYYGAHLGLGWLVPVTSTLDFDISGKYFYARTTSDTFRVNDEKYRFSNIDSHRLQLEGKLNYTEENVTLYTGLGVEYEFDGQSSMKAASTPKFVSDINGFTAIADLGVRIYPSANSPWLFQANIRGWEGERDGVSGTATIEYQF